MDASISAELKGEPRRTYKVQVLFRRGFSRDEAWRIIREACPGFSPGTFRLSWAALTKSSGRPPLTDYA